VVDAVSENQHPPVGDVGKDVAIIDREGQHMCAATVENIIDKRPLAKKVADSETETDQISNWSIDR